ncbi:MAG TPA: hypothetical protein VGL22_04380 [Terracidiphilus sp.]
MRIAAAAILAIFAAMPQSQPGARNQLENLRARVQTAIKAGDQQARIAADLELLRVLNGSPSAVEALARAYAAAGDIPKALAALNQFADLGQADDNLLKGEDKSFLALEPRTEYKQVLERFQRNQNPVSLGAAAITLPDPGLLTEDIDFDLSTHTFLITSVLEHKIVRAGLDGKIDDFASSPDGWPMLAVKVDGQRGFVWATEVALDGLSAVPKDAWGRSAVLCYDLKTGKLLHRIEGPHGSALGDMVLTSNGEPVVSDGQEGRLYRVSKGELRAMDTNEFISPQTPVPVSGADTLLVPDYVRGIAAMDLGSGQVTWLDGAKVALNGVDGLYLHGRSLILTQNGTSPQRVILLELDASLSRVNGTTVIEQGASDSPDPTHGVVVGDDFYYIANSGWSRVDDHGDVKAGSRMTAARIMRYRLR